MPDKSAREIADRILAEISEVVQRADERQVDAVVDAILGGEMVGEEEEFVPTGAPTLPEAEEEEENPEEEDA